MNKIITSLILLSLFASAENNVFKPTADQSKKPIIRKIEYRLPPLKKIEYRLDANTKNPFKLPSLPKGDQVGSFVKCVKPVKKAEENINIKDHLYNFADDVPARLERCLNVARAHKLVKAGANISLEKTCAKESNESECQNSFTKKIENLGCDHKKIATQYQISEEQSTTKLYFVSEKCQSSANNKNCSAGYNARYLDAERKDIICIKAADQKAFDAGVSDNGVNR